MLDDRITGIETFLRVAESESFAAAATRMNVTRSAIAKAIARLEARLGVRLFHRTTRKQALTDEGIRYYEHCSAAMAALDDVEMSLRDQRRPMAGRLRVSAPVLFGRHCVAPVLRALTRRHPGLEVHAEFSDRVVDLVAEGFDLAVRIGPLVDSTSLVARRVGGQRMSIFGAPSYLSTRGQPSSAGELRSHTAIMYGRASEVMPWRVKDIDGSTCEVIPRSRERYDDLQVIADSAVDGGGLAWLPSWLAAPYVASRRLSLVLDSDRVLDTEIHAVWPRARYMPRRMRLLIEELVQAIPAADGVGGNA